MSFSKSRFCLHFSIPLDERDWQNLSASRVKLVMLIWRFADLSTLQRMKSMGISVILRVPEGDYQDDLAPLRIRNVASIPQAMGMLDAVNVGVEPDTDVVHSYGEATWGQDQAYKHRREFDAVRRALQEVGIRVVSPGLKCAVRLPTGKVVRTISEDDPAAPGVRAWVMINTLPDEQGEFGWDEAQGNMVHYYAHGWEGVVDDLRYMIDLKWWTTLFHKPIWLGEVGFGSERMSGMQRMSACMEIAEILLSVRAGRQHPLGARCELLAPFVSSGTPNGHWEPFHIIRDPQAYVELGMWMQS